MKREKICSDVLGQDSSKAQEKDAGQAWHSYSYLTLMLSNKWVIIHNLYFNKNSRGKILL